MKGNAWRESRLTSLGYKHICTVDAHNSEGAFAKLELQTAQGGRNATSLSPQKNVIQTQSLSTKPAPTMTQDLDSQPAQTQFDEDAIYEVVANEMESGKTDKGLWTRLFAELDGDEKRTKIAYIKHRAEKLMAAERARIAGIERARVEEESIRKAEDERIFKMSIAYRLRHGLVSPGVAAEESGGKAGDFLSSCMRGALSDVEAMLIQFPVLVAITDSDGNTGLHHAVLKKHEPVVKSLIEHGACVSIRNRFGQTPQDIAIIGGRNISDYPVYKKISDLIEYAARAMEVD